MITVIIPAHNEELVIGRLLDRLVSTARPEELDVIVVANGCTDGTAGVAARYGPGVRVLSLPVASKWRALAAGDQAARGFPRVYLDADWELDADDVRLLAAELDRPHVLAAAPERVLVLAGRPWHVRWYYEVWRRLPEVRRGLFNRGAIAMGEAGHRRLAGLGLTAVIADDLVASLAFEEHERSVVTAARAVAHPPVTFSDLLRRRVRAVVGAVQLENSTAPLPRARTRLSDVLAIAWPNPGRAPQVALFLLVTAIARGRARRMVRRGDYSTWLRDESSRRVAVRSG